MPFSKKLFVGVHQLWLCIVCSSRLLKAVVKINDETIKIYGPITNR